MIAAIAWRIALTSPRQPEASEIGSFWSQRFAALCADAHGERFRLQRDIEVASLQQVLDEFESELDAEELSAELFAYWEHPRPLAGAEAFLDQVKLPICIVSNIDDAALACALRNLGWSFEQVVTSESARAYKPRAEPFRAALARLGCEPSQLLHVGDSIGGDLRGAAAFGIPFAWVNPAARALPQRLEPPCHVVSGVEELPALLAQALRSTR